MKIFLCYLIKNNSIEKVARLTKREINILNYAYALNSSPFKWHEA